MKHSKLAMFAVLLIAVLALAGCEDMQSTDTKQARQTEQLAADAQMKVGMPGITNFTERRFSKQLLELRDREILTYTYMELGNSGKLAYLGPSVGYGIPYSVQYTNPERAINPNLTGTSTLPQPEPNGLFMPSSSQATWVLLRNPETKRITPVYIEANISVFPYQLPASEQILDWSNKGTVAEDASFKQ
ncbi:MAG: hypothetical protein SFT92_04465 [Rickettsiales bacterium]|nr:hypothetical protein [Rickettsiales bacterium]